MIKIILTTKRIAPGKLSDGLLEDQVFYTDSYSEAMQIIREFKPHENEKLFGKPTIEIAA